VKIVIAYPLPEKGPGAVLAFLRTRLPDIRLSVDAKKNMFVIYGTSDEHDETQEILRQLYLQAEREKEAGRL